MDTALKTKRKNSGLTKAQFAEKLKIPLRTYSRYEAGTNSTDSRIPDVLTAIRIARALGVNDFKAFCELWDMEKKPVGL